MTHSLIAISSDPLDGLEYNLKLKQPILYAALWIHDMDQVLVLIFKDVLYPIICVH